jgi:hypothetical protein
MCMRRCQHSAPPAALDVAHVCACKAGLGEVLTHTVPAEGQGAGTLQRQGARKHLGEYVTWTFSPNNNGIAHQGRAG